MGERKKQSLVNGALVLAIATAIVKIVGILYKIPLTNIIGTVGRGYFGTAYNIYIPVYNIALAGLPFAIAKLVSEQMAKGHYNDVKRTFSVAMRIFLITGLVGTAFLLVFAYPYSVSIKSMQTLPSIITIAPSIFFCCVMSAYRGYFQGLRNMNPSAISQIGEVVGKLLFGLALSYAVVAYGMYRFNHGFTVFGQTVTDLADAQSAIYPYAAAAAIAGVTIGTIISMVYLMIYDRVKGDRITKEELRLAPPPESDKMLRKQLIAIAIPVVTSTLVSSLANFIDAWTIQVRLFSVISSNLDTIQNMYANALSGASVLVEDLKTYLYGAYEIALDFKNLIPTLTTAIGISAIPVLSEAYALKNKRQMKISIETVIKMTMLIALPSGIGMGVLAEPILTLLYGHSSSASTIAISAPIMAAYGYTMFIIAIAQPLIYTLQTLGRPYIPVFASLAAAGVKILVNFWLVGIPSLNINGAIIGTVLFYVVIVAVDLFYILKETKISLNYWKTFVKPLICSILSGVAAYAAFGLTKFLINKAGISLPGGTALAGTLVAVLAAVLIYGIAVLLTGAVTAEDLKMVPKGEKIAKKLAKFGFLG